MASINNMAVAAAKAVWGENQAKQEPVSGVQGDPAKGEPYDAGNMGNAPKESAEPTTAAKPQPDPAAAAPSSSAGADSTKMQNDTRAPEASTGPAAAGGGAGANPTSGAPSAGDTAKEVTTSSTGPTDEPAADKLTGPGPKMVSEVAKEHGGDAGKCTSSSLEGAEDGETKGEEKGAEQDEDDDGIQRASKGEGTGVKYIKSSGLTADGGDFDASRAGAGREADRLMVQKGIHNPSEADSAAREKGDGPAEKGDGPTEKGKRSFGEKIKEKLSRTNYS